MENILKIILNDMKGLVRNKLAFVLALAVCVLPSLYAWFNIYSNWDPYGNTANVSIAVASMDEGYTDEDGVYQNMGDSVIDGLKENHNINWVFLDSDTEAMEGVEAGEYYAAIVMGTDFRRSMYNFAENGFEHPSVTYYENQKKNAIAAKITDSARGTVQNNINEEFAIKMIKAQQPESEKLSSCDYIVKNEATIDNTYHQVDKILCEIML